uniref:CBM21 domain-containing protein n=1 Tax=Amphilophus citrinellus TaxID=61819 RepID=A0A3Q0QU78_AMPCI
MRLLSINLIIRLCKQTDYPVKTGHPFPHPSSFSTSALPSPSLSSSQLTSENFRSCLRKHISGVSKKHVVFADAKGLALTAVRIFIPEPSSPTSTLVIRPSPAKLEGQQSVSDKLNHYKLRLGFPQPTQDPKAFLARLKDMKVQLESCNISERSLSGKVYAAHVGAEKGAVCIRVTFDSWRSHHDIPCTFLRQHRCGGSDVDVFTFDLSLTHNMDPRERIEFCVSFRPGPGATPHWDNNGGQNYRVLFLGRGELNCPLKM